MIELSVETAQVMHGFIRITFEGTTSSGRSTCEMVFSTTALLWISTKASYPPSNTKFFDHCDGTLMPCFRDRLPAFKSAPTIQLCAGALNRGPGPARPSFCKGPHFSTEGHMHGKQITLTQAATICGGISGWLCLRRISKRLMTLHWLKQ